MVDTTATPPESISCGKWENFEEEESDANSSGEISDGRKHHNKRLPESAELINGDRAIKQQGDSSHKENGLTGTQFKENLDEVSKNSQLTTDDANGSLRQFDLASSSVGVQDCRSSDQVTDSALGVICEPASDLKGKEDAEENFIKSSELSRGGTDGVEGKLNGDSDIAGSRTTDGNSANNSKWTSFEEGRDTNSSREAANERKPEESTSVREDNSASTPTNPKMAAFGSSATTATNIIPNLAMVTEPGSAKMNSTPLYQVANSANTSILTENIASNSPNAANNVKSAVPNANIGSNHKSEGQTQTELNNVNDAASQNHVQPGKNWVSFGEEGKTDANLTQDGVGMLLDSPSGGGKNLETSKLPLKSDLAQPAATQVLAVNYKVKTADNIVSRGGEPVTTKENGDNSTTAASAPTSSSSATLTAADLDLLAQHSWVQFNDSAKGQKQQSSSSSADRVVTSATTSSSTQSHNSWVTFGDSSATTMGQGLDLLVLDVGSQNKPASVPSPNPFIPPQGVNPFKPTPEQNPLSAVTNPFQAESIAPVALSSEVSPYPASSNQGPISTSTPLVESTLLLVSESSSQQMASGQPSTTHKELLSNENAPKTEIAPDQVDAGAAPIVDEEAQAVAKLDDDEPLLEEKAPSTPSGSWSALLRFPDKKRRIGSRDWKSVVIRLEGTTLQIYEEYELSAPFREIPLQAYFAFTTPKLQSFERGAKVHTAKLEYVKYTEGRSLRHRGTIEHASEGTSIIKIGSPSHIVIRDLLESVNDSIRLLPAYRDRGITYRHDEVFVDVDDVSNILLSGDGTVLRKNAKVVVKLRAFLTGDPECQLVLNDIIVREREEARLRGELKPQRVHHWVKLRHCDFHKCVNVAIFEQSHAVTFHPLDACTFELMRFKVDHHKPLPLLVKTVLNVHNEQRIELKAEIQVCQETKMAKYVRSNVVFRFPIPESWVPLFRTGKVLRGEKSIKSSRGRRAAGIKSRLKHSKCSIAVTLGKAMYEPEYGSIVWRIEQLPFIHSKVPVDAPQTLTCTLDLPPGMEYPENYTPTAELEYDMAYVLVSDTNVIAVKVSNQNIPDKWVCYRAFYHYDINIDISKPASGPVRDVGCSQQ